MGPGLIHFFFIPLPPRSGLVQNLTFVRLLVSLVLLRLLGFGCGLKFKPIFGFSNLNLAFGDAQEYLPCYAPVHGHLSSRFEVQEVHHGKANEEHEFKFGYGYHSASPRVCFWLVFFSVAGAEVAVTY